MYGLRRLRTRGGGEPVGGMSDGSAAVGSPLGKRMRPPTSIGACRQTRGQSTRVEGPDRRPQAMYGLQRLRRAPAGKSKLPSACLDVMSSFDTSRRGLESDHFGFCMSGGAGCGEAYRGRRESAPPATGHMRGLQALRARGTQHHQAGVGGREDRLPRPLDGRAAGSLGHRRGTFQVLRERCGRPPAQPSEPQQLAEEKQSTQATPCGLLSYGMNRSRDGTCHTLGCPDGKIGPFPTAGVRPTRSGTAGDASRSAPPAWPVRRRHCHWPQRPPPSSGATAGARAPAAATAGAKVPAATANGEAKVPAATDTAPATATAPATTASKASLRRMIAAESPHAETQQPAPGEAAPCAGRVDAGPRQQFAWEIVAMLKPILFPLSVTTGATAALADSQQDCSQKADLDLRMRACTGSSGRDDKAQRGHTATAARSTRREATTTAPSPTTARQSRSTRKRPAPSPPRFGVLPQGRQ